MATCFQRAGAGRILHGAGFLLLSATLCGCLTTPTTKRAATTQPKTNTTNATTNSQQGNVNQTNGVNPTSNGLKPAAALPTDSSGKIGMTSGAVGPTASSGPLQFNGNSPANTTGAGNSGNVIATSNTKGAIQPVTATNIQPVLDPTPGALDATSRRTTPPPVVMDNTDPKSRQTFQRQLPPSMDGPADSSLQPVNLPTRQ